MSGRRFLTHLLRKRVDELEASRQSRRRAWEILQRIRAILVDLGQMRVATPEKKTYEAEGVILEKALTKCITDRTAALKRLAEAARQHFLWSDLDFNRAMERFTRETEGYIVAVPLFQTF